MRASPCGRDRCSFPNGQDDPAKQNHKKRWLELRPGGRGWLPVVSSLLPRSDKRCHSTTFPSFDARFSIGPCTVHLQRAPFTPPTLSSVPLHLPHCALVSCPSVPRFYSATRFAWPNAHAAPTPSLRSPSAPARACSQGELEVRFLVAVISSASVSDEARFTVSLGSR